MNLKLMALIARVLRSDERHGGRTGSRIPGPSAAFRLAGAFVCILLCALSRNAWFTIAVLAVELLRTALKPPASIRQILRPVVIAALFAAVFTLPAVFLGSPGSLGTMTMKVTESVLVLSLMNEEVSWKDTTGALQAFHLPGVVIATLDAAVRFLVILGRFSGEMLEAVSLRRVGGKNWRSAGTGGILGTTFLKSRQMARQTSEAMICRGFSGEFRNPGYREVKNRRQRMVNAAYCLIFPALAAGFWYTQSLM